MEYATLQNGLKMPMEGFGVFQVRDKEECKRSVLDAIRTGYRLIDTAASYTNEDAVGEAVREAIAEGICTREELFITSKMWVQDMQNYEMAKAAIGASLEKTGLEYLDLYLLHQAMKDYFSAWRAMEDAYRDGKLKAIGVSNFYPHVLTNFCETVEIQPMVNQVELHPYFTQENALATMKKYNIVPEAWAPLGGGRYGAFHEGLLLEIASAHGKTVGQVMLRWNIQRGVVVIPKSTHPERIEENFNMRRLLKNINDRQVRSNLMWDSAMAENGILKCGRLTDFQTHQIEHQLGAYTDCNHGQGLAVIHPVYYRHIVKDAPEKFARLAKDVFGQDTAEAGVAALESFIKECGLPTKLSRLKSAVEITPEVLRQVADTCNIIKAGPRELSRDEIYDILMECL